MMLRRVGLRVTVDDAVGGGGSWTAPRVPDGGSLQEHLLAIAEGIAALGATSARRVEVMVLAGLQDLAAYVPVAVRALNAELFLVVFLAIRHPVSVKLVIFRILSSAVL